jgi:hypothetical protein
MANPPTPTPSELPEHVTAHVTPGFGAEHISRVDGEWHLDEAGNWIKVS